MLFAKEEESLETVFGATEKEFEEFKKIDDELKTIIDDAKSLITESYNNLHRGWLNHNQQSYPNLGLYIMLLLTLVI